MCNDQLLDLAGALVDAEQADVSIKPFDAVLGQVAIATLDLNSAIGGLVHHFGGKQLATYGIGGDVASLVAGPPPFQAPWIAPPATRSMLRRSWPAPIGNLKCADWTGACRRHSARCASAAWTPDRYPLAPGKLRWPLLGERGQAFGAIVGMGMQFEQRNFVPQRRLQ